MTAALPATSPSFEDTFRLRAQARADLVRACLLDFHEALDQLQADAVSSGLAELIGADGVQEILAMAFAEVPRPDDFVPEEQSDTSEVQLEDFIAYLPMHNYIFMPTRELWPASSVNARLTPVEHDGQMVAASKWLDHHRRVEQMTWAPGEPMLIKDRVISEGGWIVRPGCTVFNLYRPPILPHGDAAAATPWLDHVRKIYSAEADHIVRWLAHRVQRPADKINHALVLGGKQGIGKDTLVEPAKRAVGPWNTFEISPQHLLGRFNGYLKSVILRISEARDLGDTNRYQFYDHSKAYIAAPPDVLRVDEKNIREYSIFNCCGVIITSNHLVDGLFLPADDRRHFVAWSELTKDDFAADYWNKIWTWYDQGGDKHVAAYLAKVDLSAFDAKSPPPKTAAFWTIVDASRSPEDSELADALDLLGNPDAITLLRVQGAASGDFAVWLRDRKNRRQIPHRFEQCDYTPVRNSAAKDGLWKISGTRQVVYAKSDITQRERLVAAQRLQGDVP